MASSGGSLGGNPIATAFAPSNSDPICGELASPMSSCPVNEAVSAVITEDSC